MKVTNQHCSGLLKYYMHHPSAEFVKPSMVKESPLDEYFRRILVQLCKSLALVLLFGSYDYQRCRECGFYHQWAGDRPSCCVQWRWVPLLAKRLMTSTPRNISPTRFLSNVSNVKQRGKMLEWERACFETDNLRDKNTIKFEVLYFNALHVIGYCQ